MASSTAPLVDAVIAAGQPGLAPVVRVGAGVAALGSLLALILGVSRTTLAMARDRHLPHALAAVHPRFGSPHRAEIAVGVVVAVVAAVVDVRGAIGFSSFAVLLYYAIANASAWTLGRRVIPGVGLAGCLLLAFLLPLSSVAIGAGVVLVGAVAYVVAPVAVGLDGGRQRHEDVVLADLVEQAGGLERVAQILLDPRHREHDSAACQFDPQLIEDVEGGQVDLDVGFGVEHEPLRPAPGSASTAASARSRKFSALAKNSGAS